MNLTHFSIFINYNFSDPWRIDAVQVSILPEAVQTQTQPRQARKITHRGQEVQVHSV